MPAKTILTILFLISLSVVIALAVRALPPAAKGDQGSKDEVLVAATALPEGTLLRAKDVVWRQKDGGTRPGQIIRPPRARDKPDEEIEEQARAAIYGAALRKSIAAGEPIYRNEIVRPGDRDFLQVTLSPQKRAVSIAVASSSTSIGILHPGDQVDVILTQTFKNDPSLARRSVGEIVAQSLRILIADPHDARANGSATGAGRSVTLEVTPEQAERINVAAELGKLSLATRSAAAGLASADSPAGATTADVKPIWAGDVSSALGDAAPTKAAIAEPPPVEIIRGAKTALASPQYRAPVGAARTP
jgi:pilus assembly protein CpaB